MEKHVKNGANNLDAHLRQFAEQHKITFEEAAEKLGIELPKIPAAGLHWWEWFWEISSGRTWNMGGLQPLTWTEIKAWADLSGVTLETWDLKLLRAMDTALLKAHAALNQQKSAKRKKPKK